MSNVIPFCTFAAVNSAIILGCNPFLALGKKIEFYVQNTTLAEKISHIGYSIFSAVCLTLSRNAAMFSLLNVTVTPLTFGVVLAVGVFALAMVVTNCIKAHFLTAEKAKAEAAAKIAAENRSWFRL